MRLETPGTGANYRIPGVPAHSAGARAPGTPKILAS
jgi:hypothetical protein